MKRIKYRLKMLIGYLNKSSNTFSKPDTDEPIDTLSMDRYIKIISIPYGIYSEFDWNMIREIENRRSMNLSLDDLSWPVSSDPLSPANDPRHPYYLPR